MDKIDTDHLVAQMIASSSSMPSHPAEPLGSAPSIHPTGPPIPLQKPIAVERPLMEIINTRRSGGLRRGPISLCELSTLLNATQLELPSCLDTQLPKIILLLWEVTGIHPGAYLYQPVDHTIVAIPTNNHSSRQLMLQDEHRNASAVLLLVSPLAGWLHEIGDRGYRAAAIQLGYITDRLYLVAEGLGLTYSGSGGFSPFLMDRFLGLDSYHQTTFFSFVVGANRN